MRIIEFDVIFISYDEPNADVHYADLCSKVPWAKRIHGIKGSDAAHKAAAELSDSEWFITVDGDNIVDLNFFNIDLDMSNPDIKVYGWCGRNIVNGLRYGNGGLKIWNKDFVLRMRTHENSDSQRGQVDFCWEKGYQNFSAAFSDSIITGSPYQAWRAGFREGVKMTLLDGIKVSPQKIQQHIWWHNIHRLRMWSTVGNHDENGKYAVLGARMGTWMTNCTDWNYVEVRDFDILRNIYEKQVDDKKVEEHAQELGERIKFELGLDWPWLNEKQSRYVLDLYKETMNLTDTYFKRMVPINV